MAEVIGQTKSAFVTDNGESIVTPDPSGYGIDALTKVTINTNVEDEHMLLSKKVTENGVYVAPEGVAYNKVTVDVTADLESIDIVSNGTYEPEEGKDGWNKIVVDVPSDVNNQDKTVTENGIVTADLGYSGLGQVTVAVEPTDEQKEEYRQEGRDEQKAKLTTISVTENGVYTKDDGYSRVTVDVHASEEEKQAERDAQKALDKAAVEALSPVHENGSYPLIGATLVVDVPASEEELAEAKAEQLAADKEVVKAASPINTNGTKTILGEDVVVDVPSDPEELEAAKEEGVAEQKAKLTDLTVTANGTYQKEDGYKKVVVDVESGGDVEHTWRIPGKSTLSGNFMEDGDRVYYKGQVAWDTSTTTTPKVIFADGDINTDSSYYMANNPNIYIAGGKEGHLQGPNWKSLAEDGSIYYEGHLFSGWTVAGSYTATNGVIDPNVTSINIKVLGTEGKLFTVGSINPDLQAVVNYDFSEWEGSQFSFAVGYGASYINYTPQHIKGLSGDYTCKWESGSYSSGFIHTIVLHNEGPTSISSNVKFPWSVNRFISEGDSRIKINKEVRPKVEMGDFDWSNVVDTTFFLGENTLEKCGGVYGLKVTTLYCLSTVLDKESAIRIKDTLSEVTGSHSLRISTHINDLFTDEDRAEIVAKGWTINVQ